MGGDDREVGSDAAWSLVAFPIACLAQAAFHSFGGFSVALALIGGLAAWTVSTSCGSRGLGRLAKKVASGLRPARNESISLKNVNLALVVILGETVACHFAVNGPDNRMAAAAWAAAVMAFVGILSTDTQLRRPVFPERGPWVVATIALTFVAMLIRLYRLDTYPTGMHGDEGNFANSALALLRGREFNLFGAELFHRHPNLFVFLQAATMSVFGVEIAAARIPAALAGALTVPTIGLLGRSLLGSRVGMFSMVLLIAQPWHLKISRMALNDATVPLFLAMVLWLLVRGWRRGHMIDFGVAGIAAGIGLWVDHHSKSVLLATTVFAIVGYITAWHQAAWKQQAWKKGLAFVSGVAITLLPFWCNSAAKGELTEFRHTAAARIFHANLRDLREAYGTQSTARILAGQTMRSALAFNHFGDRSGFAIGGGRSVFNALSGTFFLVGTAFSIWHWRKLEYGILTLWWTVGLLPDIFGSFAPTAHHLLSVLPASHLLAAVGVERAWRLLSALGGLRCAALSTIALVILSLSAAIDTAWHFSSRTNHHHWQLHSEMGTLLRALEADHELVFIGPPDVDSDYGSIRFASHDANVINVHDVDLVIPVLARAERQSAVLVTPGHFSAAPRLAHALPHGTWWHTKDTNDREHFKLFLVPEFGNGLSTRARE